MIEIRADAIALKCACHDKVFAYLQDGLLVIQSRHHGEPCLNVVPLVNVYAALEYLRNGEMVVPKESAPDGN